MSRLLLIIGVGLPAVLAVAAPSAACGQGEARQSTGAAGVIVDSSSLTGTAAGASTRAAAPTTGVVTARQVDATPIPTVEDGLQGQLPGVVVTQNNGGAPGGGMQVQIRGVASINSVAAPLYVVDGVIVNDETTDSGLNAVTAAGRVPFAQDAEDNTPNRIADLNPADVERVEVLKGPSSSAIFGSKGAAGAILITTKRGVTQGARWQLSLRGGTFLPANTLALRSFPTYASANAWWHQDGRQTSDLPTPLYNGPQDYQQQLFPGGQASGEGDLSVRGVTGHTNYFASVLSKYDNGVMLHTGYRKDAARLNLAQRFSDAISASTTLYYQHSLTIRGVTGNDNDGASPYDVFSITPQFVNLNYKTAGKFAVNPFVPANPFADAASIETPTSVTRFIGGGSLRWRVFDKAQHSMQLLFSGGADVAGQRDVVYAPPTVELEEVIRPSGVINVDHANTQYYNAGVTAVDHYTGITGIEATSSLGVAQDDRQIGNPDQVGIGLAPGVKSPAAADEFVEFQYRYRIRTQSLFAQEQITALQQRLTLSGGVTADRNASNGDFSSVFLYPKVAAAYRLATLPRFVDEVKFRAAYGQAGMAPVYGFNFNNVQNFYSTLVGDQRGVHVGLNPNSNVFYEVQDQNLRPEMSSELETGFDASLFHSRAQLSATIYQKRVTDLVLFHTTTSSPFFNDSASNGGQFTNRGIELSLTVAPLPATQPVSWQITTSFYRNYNRVDALPDGSFAEQPSFGHFYGVFLAQVGRSVSEIVNPARTNADGTPLQVGDAQPSFIMTFANSIGWGRFHVFGLVDWYRGGNIINLTNAYYDNGLFLLADSAASYKRLTQLVAGGTPYVESATFVKVRELTVSYDLPERWLARAGGQLRTARLSFSARNPFSSFRYTGLDPEVSDFGNTAVTRGQEVTPYPPARSFFVGVDLGL